VKSFNHVDVKTVDEAITLLKEHKGKAKLIAGGTDLLGILKQRILPEYPETIINIKTIAELNYVRKDERGLKIGALTRLVDIINNPAIKKGYEILAKAAESIATPQIRNMGTIGGNLVQDVRCWYYRYPHQIGGRILCLRKGGGTCLAVTGDNRYHAIMKVQKCAAVCPSDMAVALSALNAAVKIEGPDGVRIIPVIQLYKPLKHDLKNDEMVTEIQIPQPPQDARQKYLKFSLRKPVDFAIVSVASLIASESSIIRDARIALGAVSIMPIRVTAAEEAIKGKVLNEATAEMAAGLAVADAKPLSMNGYKVDITRSLVKRAVLSRS
jgi:xanthine dehydrogenase YagS FAD-binding subunit